ncbi:MAG TPA: hypothetical protein VM073_00870 [Usitatibacter sp.]|nr:hypothetical protein [Usitatibacter sp.]
MTRRIAWLAFAASFPLHAADLPFINSLAQSEFRAISEDLGAAFSYKGVTPATALGVTGFDIGVEVTDTKLENSALFRLAGAGSRSHLTIPKLHVHKGLFGGLDVGAFVGGSSEISAALYGAELRYAILDDGLVSPALGVRLSGTKATGLGDLSIGTAALDLTVSKRFAVATPYAGAGAVRVQSRVRGSSLVEERFNQSRLFAGVNVNLLAANLAFEAEKMGDNTSLSAKIGWRF